MPCVPSPLRRRRTVPSTPAMARDEMYSGMTGEFQATVSMDARLSADTRASRDRPAPLSMTSSGMSRPWRASRLLATASLLATVAGLRPRSAPSVSSSVRAMTLLLRLLIWRMTSASVGESCEASTTASPGTMPVRTWP